MPALGTIDFWVFIIPAWFIAGAVVSLLLTRYDHAANLAGGLFAITGAAAGILFAVSILMSGTIASISMPTSFPWLSVSFRVDSLSAFFVLIISLLVLLCSVYALPYVKHYYGKYNIGLLGFMYNIFIAGMIMVVTADNGIFFLIVWEIMSLASYFLVIFERDNPEHIRAGSVYFIMTHTGTAFILLAFLLLYRTTGSFDFAVIKNSASAIPPLVKNTVFLLALVGFGTKAGIIPFHTWLPSAHPSAPSHVSALMSGVMIKTGVFMLMRLFLDIMAPSPGWWGLVIVALGAVSALLGVLYALSEHDIKKLLAYHSIENIGIIFLGLGSALFFLSIGDEAVAALCLVAALYHTFNHAVFKGLLFLGAGTVISETHTRSLEEYGGLIKYMPQTAFLFLTGSLAISAMPPLNGFISEWLTFQALFSGIQLHSAFVRGVFTLAAGSLALTGGLAAACFVKVFGTTFLARPRSHAVSHASEPKLSMRAAMAVLALLTVLLGLFAGPVVSILSKVAAELGGFAGRALAPPADVWSLGLRDGFANISMPVVFALLTGGTAVVFFAVRAVFQKGRTVTCRTWDCGADLSPRMEITATGFSRSIIMIFKGILKPTQQTDTEYNDASMRYFPKTSVVTLKNANIYETYFYRPLVNTITRISGYFKKIQSGSINAYVLYIFLTLIGLLVVYVMRGM